MKKIKTLEDAYAADNLDPTKVDVIGVPERHREALIAVAHLFVIHDAVNPDFEVDFENPSQRKWSSWWKLGSPSGRGFSFLGYVLWASLSPVGSRLVSESSEATTYIAKTFPELYKKFMVYKRKVK